MSRIAVSASGTDPGADLEPRFGRCRYFLVLDEHAQLVEVVENPAAAAPGGAGAQAVQLLVGHDVGVVITGRCGQTATRALEAAGITMIDGCSGPADAVVRDYLARP